MAYLYQTEEIQAICNRVSAKYTKDFQLRPCKDFAVVRLPDRFDFLKGVDFSYGNPTLLYESYQYKADYQDPAAYSAGSIEWIKIENRAWQTDISKRDGYTTWSIRGDPRAMEEFL